MKNVLQPGGDWRRDIRPRNRWRRLCAACRSEQAVAGAAKDVLNAPIGYGDNSAEAAEQVELNHAGEEAPPGGLNTILIQTSPKL